MNYLRYRTLVAVFTIAISVASCGEGTGQTVAAPDALGSFAVGYTDFSATDTSRGRTLPISVWYPVDEADAATEPKAEYPLQNVFNLVSDVAVDGLRVSSSGPLPLLVFSHGFGGINTQSTQLMEALASHGFIVVSPEHTGNTATDQSDETPAENRVPDVSFVIDTMFERSSTVDDAFQSRIDESRVGVLGHSFGGATALGSVAGWAGADPDPRVKVIGVIAGGVGSDNFSEEALALVTEPTIFVVGTLDTSARANHNYAFAHLPNVDALFEVEVIGANHTHFANVCAIGDLLIDLGFTPEMWPGLMAGALIDPYNETCTPDVFPIAEAHRIESLYMVAHFKRYLLEDDGYDPFLTATYAEAHEPAVTFTVP